MTAPFSTPDAVKALAMDVRGVASKDVIPQALVVVASTKAGFVEGDAPAVRVPWVEFDGATFVPEGDAIPEDEPIDTEKLIYTGKVGLLATVSRELYGQQDVASLLSEAARMNLVRKANAAFLSQVAPTPPAVNPPAGILNQTVTDGGDLGTDLDGVVDAIAHIESAGGNADLILASPTAWATVAKLRTAADSNQSIVGAGTNAPQRQLLSVPVYVDRDVTADRLVVLDRTAVLSAYGNVQLAVSADYVFNRDSIALRVTFRFGQVVTDADRVVVVDTSA